MISRHALRLASSSFRFPLVQSYRTPLVFVQSRTFMFGKGKEQEAQTQQTQTPPNQQSQTQTNQTQTPNPNQTQTQQPQPKGQQSQAQATNNNTTNDTTAPPSQTPEQIRIKALEEDLANAKHELLLSIADQENTRRIAKRDVDNAKAFGIQNFATSLLDAADNLSRALDAVPKDVVSSNQHLKSLHEGVDMTNKEMKKIFAKYGLVEFNPVGQKFNPNIHQALVEVPDPTKENGIVSFVMKTGYMLKDRLIRPASVGVIKNQASAPPPPQDAENPKNPSNPQK